MTILFFLKRIDFFQINGIKKNHILFAFLSQVFAGYILYIIYSQYYTERYTADIFKYYDDSLVLYNTFFSNPLDFFKIIIGLECDSEDYLINYFSEMNHWDTSYKNSLMDESRLLIRLNAILNIIGFKSYGFNLISFVFIGFLGKFLITKNLVKFYKSINPIILFWGLILFPSLMLWSSGILKEPLIIFSIGLILQSFGVFRSKKWSSLILVFFGLVIIFKVKFYVFICFLPALISFLICQNWKIKPLKVITITSISLNVLLVILSTLKNSYNPLEILSNKQNDFIKLAEIFNAGSSFKMVPMDPNFNSFLSSIPMGVINGFFRPFPSDINKIIHILPLIENIFLYVLIIYLFYKLFSLKIKLETVYLNALLNSVFFISLLFIITGLSTPVIGALVRYKLPGTIFIIISICIMHGQTKNYENN
jgi:hypothetical protein